MDHEFNYTCPNCSGGCLVPPSMVGHNLVCPHCSSEFFATPPEPQKSTAATPPLLKSPQSQQVLPKKLPFFKSGRRKILEQRMVELVTDGELDRSDDADLTNLAAHLGLDSAELSKLKKEKFLKEFDPIRRRIESTLMMTDEDDAALHKIQKKYDVNLTLTGLNAMFRAIYLLEVKGQLPQPIQTGLMLKARETAYFSIQTTWHQTRVQTRGYSGTSVSIPSGIKGVRFRFGGYTPNRSEELTPLASGVLVVTTSRLLFNGDARNTTIPIDKIVDCHVFSDSLRIEKGTGKPDYFSMNAAEARYVLGLVGVLRTA